MSELIDHIIQIKQSQARAEEKMDNIERVVVGADGIPGLQQRVESLEGTRKYAYGAWAGSGGMLGYLLHKWFLK